MELVPNTGGAFEVIVDGKIVISKQGLGRFPFDTEVLDRISG